ncbi:hypothetical protein GOODEAATRI_001785, partial [Goodea atripinnis]
VDSEGGTSAAKKDAKRKRESSVGDDVEKRRSSRQVKRKRYTEDLEFRISEDDDSGDDSPTPKSPSSSSQQQDLTEAEGPVVEKIMGMRSAKKQIVTLYLVKWCSLAYEDATWELKADIDQSKIDEYERIAAREPNTERVVSMCL